MLDQFIWSCFLLLYFEISCLEGFLKAKINNPANNPKINAIEHIVMEFI